MNRRQFAQSVAVAAVFVSIARPIFAQNPESDAPPGGSMVPGPRHGFTRVYRPESGIERVSVGVAVLESEELAAWLNGFARGGSSVEWGSSGGD